MLKFQVFEDGRPAQSWPLRNAYLIGADGSAMRGSVSFQNGLIICEKQEPGTAALALQQRAGELGELTLQTCLLPERDEPYLLTLELARHRLMTLYTKLEDWGMLELDDAHPVTRRAEKGREQFIEALCLQRDDPVHASQIAEECLITALDGSEELSLAHAALLLNRRKNANMLPRLLMGCGVSLPHNGEKVRQGIQAVFDYIQLPLAWRQLAPEEGEYNWKLADNWAEWAGRSRIPVVAGPLLSFEPGNPPDWLYIWEHDYETVRDLIYEHVERVVERYKHVVSAWNVVSGLHVNKHFTFNFEQLMDLTRMVTMLVKKLAPQSRVLVEIRQPFGEYFSSNQRSIPPMMYADLITQSAIQFDGFAIRLLMGQAVPGQYTRDLMQVSNLLDSFQPFAKPLYLTVGAPSEPVTPMMIANPESNEPVDAASGYWRRPWSPTVQSHWLEAMFQVAISKPFVEAVAWQDFIDHLDVELPLAGLITEELQPKHALRRLVTFRRTLLSAGGVVKQPTSGASGAEGNPGGTGAKPGVNGNAAPASADDSVGSGSPA